MGLHWMSVETRLGRFLVASRDGRLVHVGLPGTDEVSLLRHLHRFFPDQEVGAGTDHVLLEAARQLGEYAEGLRTDFELPVDPPGTEFQRRVWDELSAIPYGQTRSYGEVAEAVGKPGASRAVGQANGRNPLPVVVPCHRVLAADGGVGGYMGQWGEGGGIVFKQRLLELERRGRLALEQTA